MNDLTGFQRDLLYVIAGADQPSGQDVRMRWNGTTRVKSITAACIGRVESPYCVGIHCFTARLML